MGRDSLGTGWGQPGGTARTHRSVPSPSSAVRKSKKRALCALFCSAEPTTPMEETSSWAQGSAEPDTTMGSPLRTVTFTRCRHTHGHGHGPDPGAGPDPGPGPGAGAAPGRPPAPHSPQRACLRWRRWRRTASEAAPAAGARPPGWCPAPRTAWRHSPQRRQPGTGSGEPSRGSSPPPSRSSPSRPAPPRPAPEK